MDAASRRERPVCLRLEEEAAGVDGLGCEAPSYSLLVGPLGEQLIDLFFVQRKKQGAHHHLDPLDLVARTAPEQQGRGFR